MNKINTRIGIISLGELCEEDLQDAGYVFSIPSYQRGYRWRSEHVQALVDDLASFEDNTNYCLQPIVLQKIEGKKKTFRVVDGQQRLTTLNLILKRWKADTPTVCFAGKNVWTMDNEIKQDKESELTLKCKANTIEEAGRVEEDKKNRILGKLDKIFFIWYLLESFEDGHAAFQRLNSGKIPLTCSELIRAKLLLANNAHTFEIAAEWERIEQRLRDDRFWFMFNDRPSESYTRIDRLFEIVADKEPDIKTDPLAPYYWVEKTITDFLNRNSTSLPFANRDVNAEGALFIWEKILNLFWMLEQCYSDIELYHYIGWLRHFKKMKFKGIYELYRKDRGTFKKELQKKILKEIIETNGIESSQDIADNLFARYDYSSPKDKLRQIFVLFNIEAINIKARNSGDGIKMINEYERFPFEMYSDLSWDIEHIESHTKNPMTKKEEQIEWAIEFYFYTTDEKKKKIRSWLQQNQNKSIIHSVLDKIGKTENDIFLDNPKNEPLIDFNSIYEGSDLSEEDKNRLSNLTLLDKTTNRGYHNAIFPIKRRTIIYTDRNSSFVKENKINKEPNIFIPLCTRNVFTKYYTDYPVSITQWTKKDAECYKVALCECFKKFVDETNDKDTIK